MHITEIIIKPILTEKSYTKLDQGYYTFEVNPKANKIEIKKAFETIFEVKVENVNIMKYDRKAKKLGRYAGFKKGYKKAIIKLKEGYSLDLFANESDNKKGAK